MPFQASSCPCRESIWSRWTYWVTSGAGRIRFTWSGSDSVTNWSSIANWAEATAPVSSASTAITFSGSSRLNALQDIAASLQLNSLTFDKTAGAFVLTGSGLDFQQDGGAAPAITQSSSALVTIDNNLTLSGGASYNGNGSMIVNGDVSGSGSLTKFGSGTLTLSGTNTYSGGTTVSEGTLVFAGADAVLDGSNLTVGKPARIRRPGAARRAVKRRARPRAFDARRAGGCNRGLV